MLNMENAEEVMQILERFTRLKQKEIPKELDDYMHYVAKTGDTVFKWSSLKYLFREKLLNVIKNFHDTSPRVDDLPQYPNVDPFNYESMKSSLLERLELFNAAPFSVQRLCELLTEPRKQYSRIDKFMRALEKNILVSTIEPGRKRTESENGDSLDSVVNGDVSLDVNVDIDMENDTIFNAETQSNATSSSTPTSQPSSNLTHKPDDDILPNPKKPKLDLDETHDAETEAATKSIINSKTDSPAADSPVEKPIAEEPTTAANDIVGIKKNDESAAEESTVVSEEKPPADGESKSDKKSESEKMEEDLPAVASSDEKVEVLEKKAEEKAESGAAVAESTEKVTPPIPTPDGPAEVASAVVDDVDTTDITEKIDDKSEGKKKDCAEEILEKQNTTKEPQAKKVIEEKTDDDEKAENGDLKKNEEKTETTITTTNLEKTNEKQAESAPEEKAVALSTEEKTSQEILKDKAEVTTAEATVEVVVEKSKDEVEISKAENVSSTVPEEPLKSDEAKPVAEEATVMATSLSAEEIKEPSTENSVEAAEKIDAADQPPPATTGSSQTESLQIPVEIQPSAAAEQKEKETEKPVDVPPPAVAEAASNDTAVPLLLEVPIVTVDQPMEENPESIAEAEPVVPIIIIEAAANVEEVVMGGDSVVEMATDSIEPAKDEPAGMEVDDTSQEAMDQ